MFIVNNGSRFETLRQDLHEAYGHAHDAKTINAKLDEIITKHKSKAILDDYIAVLVEREVMEYFGAHRNHVRFAAGLKIGRASCRERGWGMCGVVAGTEAS